MLLMDRGTSCQEPGSTCDRWIPTWPILSHMGMTMGSRASQGETAIALTKNRRPWR